MKKQRIAPLRSTLLGLVASSLLSTASPFARAQESPRPEKPTYGHSGNPNGNYNPTYNPESIAIKRWYQANTGPTTFVVPPSSAGTTSIEFDGTNIWVDSYGTGKLNLFNVNGQRLATVNVGGSPLGMVYDGSSIWVTNGQGLQKVRTVPPYTITNISVSGLLTPYFLAFDGSHVWVSDTADNQLIAVSVNAPYSSTRFAVGLGPTGIAFDGDCMWVTDTNDGTVWTVPDPYGFNCQINSGVAGPVNWHASSGAQPYYIAYDGVNM